MLIVNGLAGSTTFINHRNTADVSNANLTLFTPAGLTFAIWGIIYLLLGVYILFALGVIKLPKVKPTSVVYQKINGLLTISSIINILWLLSWQFEVFWLTIVLMILLLLTLIRIHTLVFDLKLNTQKSLILRMPFSIYFGWISIATVANISTAIVAWDWAMFDNNQAIWMIVTTITATLIGLTVGINRQDPWYLLVYVWAYLGIIIRHLNNAPEGFDQQYPEIIIAVSIMLVIILAVITKLIFKRHKPKK